MDGMDEGREHLPPVEVDLTMAQASHQSQMAAVEQHMVRARPAASNLVARARLLVRNGVDLRHPERVADFVSDQMRDALDEATVGECMCGGARGVAAAALLAAVTSELACLLEGRDL